MPKPRGRYRTDDNTDLLDKIVQLEERIERMERTPSIPFTAIDKGALTIKDGSNRTIIELGTTSDGRVGLRINDTAGVAQIRSGQLASSGYGLEVIDPSTNALVNLATLAFGIRGANVAATESITGGAGSSYRDLTTVGPSVVVNVGTSGNCIIMLGAVVSPGGGTTAIMGVDIVGPTSRFAVAGSASDFDGLYLFSPSAPNTISAAMSRVQLQTGLVAGEYTITAKYRIAGANTSFWSNRNVIAIPF